MSAACIFLCIQEGQVLCVVQVAPRANKISLSFACDRVEPILSLCGGGGQGVEPCVREMIASWNHRRKYIYHQQRDVGIDEMMSASATTRSWNKRKMSAAASDMSLAN
jgi:hypothetical protein